MRMPSDHFKKHLKVTYPNHAYPIKLKECTMMKTYMTSRALTKGKKPDGDLGGGGNVATPFLEEESVMLIYSGPILP
jgi:hypothetical protein